MLVCKRLKFRLFAMQRLNKNRDKAARHVHATSENCHIKSQETHISRMTYKYDIRPKSY